jgi:flagellar motor protein MotB
MKSGDSRLEEAETRVDAGKALTGLGCVGLILLFGACSTMEDIGEATADGLSAAGTAMNPFNWFGDDDEDEAGTTTSSEKHQRAKVRSKTNSARSRGELAQRDNAQSGEYPKLSTVPERPKEQTSKRAARDRNAVREGLVADTQNAQYSDQQLRAQTAPPPAPVAVPFARQPDASRANDRAAAVPSGPAGSAPRVAPPGRAAAGTAVAAPGSTPRIVPELRVIGHSSVGPQDRYSERQQVVNYKVSLDRANSVASQIVRTGIPRDRMKVTAEGDRNPIYSESSPTGAAGNRRTEIYLEYYDRG